MVEIIQFFSIHSIWVYLVLIIILFFPVRNLIRQSREKKDLVFGLEKEISQSHITQSLTFIIFIGLLLLGEFILSTLFAPILPGTSLLMTPTVNPLENTLGSSFLGIQSTGTVQATSQPQAEGCIPGQIMLTYPKAGQDVTGNITILGTADIPNFGFYKFEYAIQGSNSWSTIMAGRDVLVEKNLGYWDTTQLSPGSYQLRLVVSDNNGNELPACVIPIQVVK